MQLTTSFYLAGTLLSQLLSRYLLSSLNCRRNQEMVTMPLNKLLCSSLSISSQMIFNKAFTNQ